MRNGRAGNIYSRIYLYNATENNVGKTVSKYNTTFSVLYLSTFKCQILKYLYIHVQRKI
jgi:hypothetical protein